MHVRNCWYVAAWECELAKGALTPRKIMGEPIVLYRASDGALVALEDRCCHRFAPLSKGRLEGDAVRCMYHGLKYDRTGRCIEIPNEDRIPPQAKVRAYPVVERHSWIWVWMGDPALADPALIPRAIGLDDKGWMLQSGQLDYNAGCELINDNLLDFSHLSFVHPNTLGKGANYAGSPPKVTPLPRGVRVTRWIKGRRGMEALKRVGMNGDQWQSYDYLLPGVLLLGGETYPEGTGDAHPNGPPATLKPMSRSFSSQAVTPVTERTSRYFFSWGLPVETASEELVSGMMAVARAAFEEDRAMIEAQQVIIDASPEARMMAIPADAALFQFRRLMKQLADAESGIALAGE